MKHFIRYAEKRKSRIGNLINRLKPPFRVQDIHLLRVELKKLKAVARLLHFDQPDELSPHLPSIIRSVFRQAGAVRDNQLLISYFKRKAVAHHYPALEPLLRGRLKKSETALYLLLRASAVRSTLNLVTTGARQVHKGKANNRIRKLSRKADQLMRSVKLHPSKLHRLRIKLKELSYLQAACGQKRGKRNSWLNEAGIWHDIVTRMNLMKKLMEEAALPPSVSLSIQQLIRRQNQNASLRFGQLLRQLPA